MMLEDVLKKMPINTIASILIADQTLFLHRSDDIVLMSNESFMPDPSDEELEHYLQSGAMTRDGQLVTLNADRFQALQGIVSVDVYEQAVDVLDAIGTIVWAQAVHPESREHLTTDSLAFRMDPLFQVPHWAKQMKIDLVKMKANELLRMNECFSD